MTIGPRPNGPPFDPDQFTASAAQTDFVLTYVPGGAKNVIVAVDGSLISDYDVSGNTLTINDPALAGGEVVDVRYLGGAALIAVAAGGEVNTASNVGTGQGVFKTKSSEDLQFYKLLSSSALLTIVLVSNDIVFTINEANLDVGNMTGVIDDTMHGSRSGGSLHDNATTSVAGFMSSSDKSKLDGIEAAADVTDATNVNAAGAVMETDYNANTVLAAASDNTPLPVTISTDELLGNQGSGPEGLSASEVRSILNVEDGADVTDATNVNAAGAVMESDYNANTILKADSDDTPTALTVPEDRLVGRITGGSITALTPTQVRGLLNVADGAEANTVDSVFGRTGTVTAATSDYDASQIDNDSGVSGATVADALDALEAAISAGGIPASTLDANTILKADADDTPEALTVGEQTLVGRITGGEIAALTASQVRTLLNIEDGATADQTASDIRALGFFDTSNDGSLSGLDADLLDGNHASAFATAAQGSTADSALQDVVDDTSPTLGGNLEVNGKAFVDTFTAGEAVAAGNLCYLKSDGKMWKADADAASTTSGLLAIATGSISADATGAFILWGKVTGLSSLTVAAKQYVSATAGAMTETAPSSSGQQVRIVGYALSTTTMFFAPDNTYIEVA